MMPSQTRARLFNIPNSLSILRLLTAPVLVVLLLNPGARLSLVSAAVFGLICTTDWLDGYLARRMGVVTSLGKFLDPLADKLLVTTALIMLVPLGRAPAWMVALIVGREIAVTGLRAVASEMGIVIAANQLGKYKTVFQIISLVPLMIHYPFFRIDFHSIGFIFLVLAFILTMVSGIDYFVKFFKANGLRQE